MASVEILQEKASTDEARGRAAETLVNNALGWNTESPQAVEMRDYIAGSIGKLMITDPEKGQQALDLFLSGAGNMHSGQENNILPAIPFALEGLMVLLGGTAIAANTDEGKELASSLIDSVGNGISSAYEGLKGAFKTELNTEEGLFGRALTDQEIFASLKPGQAYEREDGTLLVKTESGLDWPTTTNNPLANSYTRLAATDIVGVNSGGFEIAEPGSTTYVNPGAEASAPLHTGHNSPPVEIGQPGGFDIVDIGVPDNTAHGGQGEIDIPFIVFQDHHLCTDKNCISDKTGGPWTPVFDEIFSKGGLTLSDPLNKIYVPGHKGPHPQEYHEYIFDRLSSALEGLKPNTPEYTESLKNTLRDLQKEAVDPDSQVNKWLTRK